MIKNILATIGFGYVTYGVVKLFQYVVDQRVGHIVNNRTTTT